MTLLRDTYQSAVALFRNSVPGWRVVIRFAVVLGPAAGLRIVSHGGLIGSDDLTYAELAQKLVQRTWSVTAYEGTPALRIGIIAPTALAFRLVGVREPALAIYPLVLSLASIVLAFIAGRMFFNERAGYIAAALQALMPIDVRISTLLLPDLPAAFWANVGILLLYLGSKQPRDTTKGACGVLAGLALGVSWLCKETILFSLPFVGLYLAWSIYEKKRNIRLAAALAVGVALVLSLESLFYYVQTSDPFHHFTAIERHNRWPVATVWFWRSTAPWSALLLRLFRDGPEAILLNTEFGLVTCIALLGIAYAAFKRESSALFVSLWFLYHAFIFNFGSHSMRSYMPLPIAAWTRYLYPLILPAVLLAAALLDSLLPGKRSPQTSVVCERRFWGTAVVVVLALGVIHGLYRNTKDADVSRIERTVAKMISPDTVLYTDPRTAAVLRFYWAYPEHDRTVDFRGMEWRDIHRGSYVLFNPRRVEVISHYGYDLPSFYEKPPTSWKLQWQGSPATLYRVPDL